MTTKLEKYWEHPIAAYDGYKSAHESAGTKNSYRRHTPDDATTIRVVFWPPAMQDLQDFMSANAEVIKQAGHVARSTQVTLCSD